LTPESPSGTIRSLAVKQGRTLNVKTIRTLVAAAFLLPLAALAQTPAAPEPPKPPPWYSTVTLGGFVDAFYQARLDAAQDAPIAQRAFDAATGFNLGDAVLSANMPPAPAGFHVDLQFGNTATAIDNVAAFWAGTPTATPTLAKHILQAYAALKLGKAELHVGRFVTASSAEVVPAKDNWLYSRSFLYNLVPVGHTGAHLVYPLSDTLSLRVGVCNGWDVVSTAFAGKTGEAQLAYSGPSNTTLAVTSYFGPNPALWSGAPNTASAWRTLVDVVAGTTVGPLGLLANLDWANEAADAWVGGSLAARYSLPGDVARVTVRGEYVKDYNGARFGTGIDTNAYEGTVGLSFPVGSNSELRVEGRYDKASKDAFNKGVPTDRQITGTVAALAWF